MNILLAYPEMPSTFWTLDHLMKLVGKKACYPPLGLLTIAALLPEDWNKRLVDLNICPLSDKDLIWADLVFISAMNVQAPSVREIISRCASMDARVVAGGSLFTHEYESFDGVDHFVLNEAELTLPPFIVDLECGSTKPVYKASSFADIQSTPPPLWHLADLRQYAYAIVQYSRGCPYMCDFCDVTVLFGRKPRVKTPDQIITELETLGDLRLFDLILFADDNLIGNKKHLKSELLPALIDWRRRSDPPVGFATQVTINLADDPELMQLMLEAGFRHLFVGIETPEEQSLLASRKRQNAKRDLLQNVRHLQKSGFIITGGFIVGFDTDTTGVFKRQVDFIQESGTVIATMNLLKAPPGTELHDRMLREERLIDGFDFDENKTNIVPAIDVDALYEGYEYVLRSVYSPKSVYQRVLTFMKGYAGPRVEFPIARRFRLKDIGIAARFFFHLGMVEEERRYFWKLFFWMLGHRRSHLEFAFLFAGLMHQFRRMLDRYLDSSRSEEHRRLLETTRARQSRVADRTDRSPKELETA